MKSNAASRPGTATCSKYTSRSGPSCARHSRTRRCSVRSCPGAKRPGCRRHSSRNSVSACRRPSVSATSRGTTSDSHTSANGSSRVRHVRGPRTAAGNAPLSHRRAVRSLMPAAAAAAASVFPLIRFSRNRRTCASVTNPPSQAKRAVSHAPHPVRDPPSSTGQNLMIGGGAHPEGMKRGRRRRADRRLRRGPAVRVILSIGGSGAVVAEITRWWALIPSPLSKLTRRAWHRAPNRTRPWTSSKSSPAARRVFPAPGRFPLPPSWRFLMMRETVDTDAWRTDDMHVVCPRGPASTCTR